MNPGSSGRIVEAERSGTERNHGRPSDPQPCVNFEFGGGEVLSDQLRRADRGRKFCVDRLNGEHVSSQVHQRLCRSQVNYDRSRGGIDIERRLPGIHERVACSAIGARHFSSIQIGHEAVVIIDHQRQWLRKSRLSAGQAELFPEIKRRRLAFHAERKIRRNPAQAVSRRKVARGPALREELRLHPGPATSDPWHSVTRPRKLLLARGGAKFIYNDGCVRVCREADQYRAKIGESHNERFGCWLRGRGSMHADYRCRALFTCRAVGFRPSGYGQVTILSLINGGQWLAMKKRLCCWSWAARSDARSAFLPWLGKKVRVLSILISYVASDSRWFHRVLSRQCARSLVAIAQPISLVCFRHGFTGLAFRLFGPADFHHCPQSGH